MNQRECRQQDKENRDSSNTHYQTYCYLTVYMCDNPQLKNNTDFFEHTPLVQMKIYPTQETGSNPTTQQMDRYQQKPNPRTIKSKTGLFYALSNPDMTA
jgi:hypothetical protein